MTIAFKWSYTCANFSMIDCLAVCTLGTSLANAKGDAFTTSTITSFSWAAIIILLTSNIYALYYGIALLSRRAVTDTNMTFCFTQSLTATWDKLARIMTLFGSAFFWIWAILVSQALIYNWNWFELFSLLKMWYTTKTYRYSTQYEDLQPILQDIDKWIYVRKLYIQLSGRRDHMEQDKDLGINGQCMIACHHTLHHIDILQF